MPTSPLLPKELQKAYRSSLTNPPEIKQLLAVMVNSLELDALGFIKLKLQYFGHLMRRVDSLEKTLMLGGKQISCRVKEALQSLEEQAARMCET